MKSIKKSYFKFLVEMKYLWILFSQLRKIKFIFLLVLSFFSTFFEILGITVLIIFLNIILNGNYLSYIGKDIDLIKHISFSLNLPFEVILISSITIFFILSFFFKMFLLIFQTKFTYEVAKILANKSFSKTLNLSVLSLKNKHSSEIISIIISKINICVNHILFPVISALTSFSNIIIIGVYLLYINFLVTGIFIACIIITYLIITSISNRTVVRANKLIKISDLGLVKKIQETLKGFREVKLNLLDEVILSDFKEHNNKLRDNQSKIRIIGTSPKLFLEVIILILISSFTVFAFMADQKNILPFLGGLIIAMQRLLPGANQIYFAITSYNSNSLIVKEVLNYIKTESIIPITSKAKTIVEKVNTITFKNVSFRYKNNQNYILKNLNFSINNHSKILIIGDTGSGKSTLLDLICGFCFPTKGEILINDLKLSEIDLTHWRKKITYISQDPYIFNETVNKNISLEFKKTINLNKVKFAATKAEISSEIKALENNFNFLINEGGINLSGGQKQRIALARSFYKSKEILLFDEATNSVDINKENKIIKNILSLSENRIIFFISHSEIKNLGWDFILKFKKNKITLKKISK